MKLDQMGLFMNFASGVEGVPFLVVEYSIFWHLTGQPQKRHYGFGLRFDVRGVPSPL